MIILNQIDKILKIKKLNILHNIDKPWGGYLEIDEKQSKIFFNLFYNNSILNKINFKSKLTPKILFINPKKRLSWQYHKRRSEIWSVIQGNILISKSVNDNNGSLIQLKKGEQIEIGNKIRHRIIGTEDYALVAEIWIHTDKSNPSDENDIIRLQDDFNRN